MLVLAGDEPALTALRKDYVPRIEDGPLIEAFTVLTADQLRGLADLPRLQRELQLFRDMPPRLEALRAGGSVTR
jgi:antirestriction protein ArdC